ncbi:hypothetical protein HYC85_032079 [Camellia sinensis]|uniref:Uncharacterized protein n=1 Tax=Camellia sinensis TaxID=4442 RepID=A0A7J7FW51_CAMSI|nr:hypothetical protein HYC85_032079 [Camellia sinensis]
MVPPWNDFSCHRRHSRNRVPSSLSLYMHVIVKELGGLGARVHTCAQNETELKRCLRDWEDEEFGVTGSVCDMSSRCQREELLDFIFSVFNGKLNILIRFRIGIGIGNEKGKGKMLFGHFEDTRVHCLNSRINNVGTNIRRPVVEYTAKEYAILFATNFESVFHMCQLVHPLLKALGAGSVVFTSSVSGFVSLSLCPWCNKREILVLLRNNYKNPILSVARDWIVDGLVC